MVSKTFSTTSSTDPRGTTKVPRAAMFPLRSHFYYIGWNSPRGFLTQVVGADTEHSRFTSLSLVPYLAPGVCRAPFFAGRMA
jgi:hypothetical protein